MKLGLTLRREREMEKKSFHNYQCDVRYPYIGLKMMYISSVCWVESVRVSGFGSTFHTYMEFD